jgi:proton-coupled amino acid transporter|mmetsp:Transcript_16125/g.29154  ORF Transcript_16125/g.29154 Transcript_16125/m.29154 type:complete len:457 (+) Transcript_16125:19-1389(+)
MMGTTMSEDLHAQDDSASKQSNHHRRTLVHPPSIELTEQGTADDETSVEEVRPLVVDGVLTHNALGAPGTASSAAVAINIIISFVGAGLLGIPDAFRRAGWGLGSVALCLVSALNVYCMLLLVQVQKKLFKEGKESVSSYGLVGRCIMGSRGGAFVDACLVVSQAGFATAYIIFIAANLYSIYGTPRSIVCFGCIPGLALLVQAREMKTLAPFSLLADLANLCGLSAVLLQDFKSYVPHNDSIHAIRWEGLLYVMSITIYSMEGVGLVLSLESSCRDRSKFASLLKSVLACITLFMAFFGTAGYMAFGDNTMAPITLNLVGQGWASFVKGALCLALYLTYPIMMFPIWHISEELFTPLHENVVWNTAFRCILVVFTATVAYSVPNFGSFLSLVGSSICTILGFILPCYFHLAVLRKELPYWQVGLDCLLMVGGVLFGMLGTYQSFVNLVNGSASIH